MSGVLINWSQRPSLGEDEIDHAGDLSEAMSEKLKQGVMRNKGTAIILSLIIVTVLFILTSFLIRKVTTNTMMVRKATEEQTSHSLAKQGILYAVDQLNTSDVYSPNYDPTDWPGPGNKNWIELDLDNGDEDNDVTTGDKECRVRVDKDDLPPDVFDLSDLDDDSAYVTIESQDLPKRSVSLQAIAQNTTPLLKYMRFVNSDTVFDNETFGAPDDDEYLIQGNAPLCILGNVTWESASINNLILSTDESKAVIYGTISDGGVSTLNINGANPHGSSYSYFFDPDDPSYDDPTLFDTAEGHYFSSAHLPSCYDYSGGEAPSFYYGSTQITFWPEIRKNRYQNLASGVNCYLNNPGEINEETEWSDPTNDNNPSYDNDTDNEWFNDGEPSVTTISYHYYPYAPRLVFNNIDTDTSGSEDLSEYLSDETLNTIDYSDITNGIIFAEGDVSVSGIIPDGRNLTIVSGGNIFIDSNLLKETNSASLALLTKQDIVLNPTLRYGVASTNTSSNPSWYNPDNCLGNPDAANYTSPESGSTSFAPDETKIYTLDIDLGKLVTGGRVVLWDYEDADHAQLETKLQAWVTRDDLPPSDSSNWDEQVWNTDVPTADSHSIDFTPRTFRWIRLNLQAHNKHEIQPQVFDLSEERFDAVEIPIYGIDAALCADEGNLKVVTGGGVDQANSILPNNNAYEPNGGGLKRPSDSGSFPQRLFFWGSLAEEEWTGSVTGWNYVSYVYDSNLSSHSPPSLPSSVNLVSLKRKDEG